MLARLKTCRGIVLPTITHLNRSKDNFAVFLIKAAFWICVVIMLVPVDTGPAKVETATKAQYSEPLSHQAVGAARATVTDMSSFCDRNPDVCQTGSKFLTHFAAKAAAVAGKVFTMVSSSSAPAPRVAPNAATQPAGLDRNAPAGSSEPAFEPVRTQRTLLPSDRSAPWVGPIDSAV